MPPKRSSKTKAEETVQPKCSLKTKAEKTVPPKASKKKKVDDVASAQEMAPKKPETTVPPNASKKQKASESTSAEEKPAKKPKPDKPRKAKRRPDYGETIYVVGYALSDRSTCKWCKLKIAKGEVRLGSTTPGEGDYDCTSWSHVECQPCPLDISEEETLSEAKQIELFEYLEEADQDMLTNWFKQASKGGKTSEKPIEPQAATVEGEQEEPAPQGTLLECPFREREEVQRLGAKWDFRAKRWMVPFSKELDPFDKWVPKVGKSGIIEAHAAAMAAACSGDSSTTALDDMEAEADDARPRIEPEAVAKMTVAVLKQELEARGLDASGKKAELVQRLSDNLTQHSVAPRARRVDRGVPGGGEYRIFEEFDVKLVRSEIVKGKNVNRLYIIQVLKKREGTGYATWNRWARMGEDGEGKLYPFDEAAGAIEAFRLKFEEKTHNTWENYKAGNFSRDEKWYGIVETDESAEGDSDAPLGKLSVAQIEKGQAMLAKLKAVLEREAPEGEIDEDGIAAEIESFSSEFYTLIPTSSGRQAPPPLNTLELIGEKESQLDFWLRMGFEETHSLLANPIKGLMALPLPGSLKEACSKDKVSDAKSISASVSRGKTLAKRKAGSPTRPMDAEKYGAIILYTGNSIYRELNTALREKHVGVPKFMAYLRLFFEAMGCLPCNKTTLWRGIAADLFDKYAEGAEITWWSVSSCTSDKKVAQDFMSQLGGTATLLTLEATSAMDITPLSVYANEKESLLLPGTKLRVISRKRRGKIVEIHVKEVGSALEE